MRKNFVDRRRVVGKVVLFWGREEERKGLLTLSIKLHILIGNNIYPIVAGQIIVGCCERKNRTTFKKSCLKSMLVIAMPNNFDCDNGYFGPYAALYAADIMLTRGNNAAAQRYARQAQKLNNGEYSKEIAQRIALTLRAVKY